MAIRQWRRVKTRFHVIALQDNKQLIESLLDSNPGNASAKNFWLDEDKHED